MFQVRVSHTSFLGVIIDESLNWTKHIKTIENKVSKNLGILYRAKQYLNLNSLKQLYFAFINSYLNYGNIIWGSTYKSKLKKLYSKQKHACRIIFREDRYTSVHHRLKEIGALDIYQLNTYQTLTFMHQVKHQSCPSLFKSQFFNIDHKYPTRYSRNAFKIPFANLNVKRFSIRYRGPFLWNTVLSDELKNQSSQMSFACFKKTLKKYLID